MSDGTGSTPPGWYPLPDGSQGYWDGQSWSTLPDPGPAQLTDDGGRKALTNAVIALAALVAIGIGFLVWKNNQDTQMRNADIAASSSKAAADASAAAAAKAAADAEADRIRRANEAKIADRNAGIKEMEATIKDFAEKQGREGLFDGPVLSVSCDPVGGGKTDDLTAETTIFECFAAVNIESDGTMTGKKYHATMNWDTGNYTYGLGAPG